MGAAKSNEQLVSLTTVVFERRQEIGSFHSCGTQALHLW